jgi:hypothetical protein
MRKILLLLAFLSATAASAQVGYRVRPFFWGNGTWLGYPVVWGGYYSNYFYNSAGYWGNPYYNYWNNPYYSGYSYYSYYNYNTYYASFGVISYSVEKDTWGSSWGQSNKSLAMTVANNYCSADNCKPVVWVQGGCAVLTTSASTKRVGWGIGNTHEAATQAGKNACIDEKGVALADCQERAWICTC